MSSNIGSSFDKDYQQLENDANDFNTYQQQLQAAEDAYIKEFLAAFNSKNPELVFLALIYAFGNAGFSELDAGLGLQGQALKIQGDLAKLGNDLENTSHLNSGSPAVVHEEVLRLDETLSALDSKNGKTGWYKYLQEAIGSTAASTLFQGYDKIRKDIYDGDDTSSQYNPKLNTNDPKTKDRTYHFDINSTDEYAKDYLKSFAEEMNDMKKKGDPKYANEASKLWSDNFNTNTSTTQSVQAATNELITNDTNTIKTFQSFTTDMMHALAQVISAAVQNYTKA